MDNKKDTVLIYTVYNNNENIFYRSHGPFLTGFEGSVAKSDTLTFTFTYGFKPVQILIEESDPMEYIIILNREFRSKYFLNSEYIIRKRKLIRVNDKVKFRKLKSRAV